MFRPEHQRVLGRGGALRIHQRIFRVARAGRFKFAFAWEAEGSVEAATRGLVIGFDVGVARSITIVSDDQADVGGKHSIVIAKPVVR